MDFNLTDVGAVAVVIAATELLKKHVRERWIPLIPLALGLLVAMPVVIIDEYGWPGEAVFAARTVLEGLKIAFAAMGTFKVYKTTVKGE